MWLFGSVSLIHSDDGNRSLFCRMRSFDVDPFSLSSSNRIKSKSRIFHRSDAPSSSSLGGLPTRLRCTHKTKFVGGGTRRDTHG